MPLTIADVEKVRDLVSLNKSDPEIGAEFDTTDKMVYKFRKRHGIPSARKGGAQPGQFHKSWKGGRVIDKSGYVLLHRPEHPSCSNSGYVREHRLVMEGVLGRLLEPKEVVHHLNGIKDDNRPENLSLYSKNADHLRAELTGRAPKWTEDGLRRMLEGSRKSSGKGRKLTPEQKQAASDRMKGRVFSPEWRANISAAQKRKAPASEETRRKLSEAAKGRVHTPEHNAKMSAALKGRVLSPEWRKKISDAAKARYARKAESQSQVTTEPPTPLS